MGERDGRARSYTLILGGGGARGFAHAGVLRALERLECLPSALVGVSMGAIIGAAYSLRRDWYAALLDFAEVGLPTSEGRSPSFTGGARSKIRKAASRARALWDLNRGWGTSGEEVAVGRDALRQFMGGADLADGRIPIAVSTTDLLSGERVVIREGPAFDAVYASSALAGVFPPQSRGSYLLADGAYTDVCPIDVALDYGNDCLVAVNPGRSDVVQEIRSGLEAIVRATEICYTHHATLRFAAADIIIKPPFRRPIDTLEFSAFRECIAAGIRGVRANRRELGSVLLRA